MQVQLLKKTGAQRFVGQCVRSNAILRFDVPYLPATVAMHDTLTLTNCQFVPVANSIKCEFSGETVADSKTVADASAPRAKRPSPDIAASL